MIRLALLFVLVAAPALSQTRPVPRPDDLAQTTAPEVTAPQPAEVEIPQAAAEPEPPEAETAAPAVAEPVTLADQLLGGLRPCWNIGALSAEAQEVAILVAFEIAPDGVPMRDTIALRMFRNGTQDAADEALGAAFRAILRCGATGFDLPTEQYEQWRRVEVWFDASGAVSR